MISKTEMKWQARIKEIQKILSEMGEMRPGSLSMQYNVCGNPSCRCKDKKNPKKHGPYYQLSYTHKGKSTTEFVKAEKVDEVRQQIKNFRELKKLTDEWVDLSVKIAKLRNSTVVSSVSRYHFHSRDSIRLCAFEDEFRQFRL
jgi:hypothetical protein